MDTLDVGKIIDTFSLTYHLDNTPVGIMVLDEDQKIIYWSSAAAEIFDWPASDVLHRSIISLNIIYHEDKEQVFDALEMILSGNSVKNHLINRNTTRTGKVIYCEWYNSALKDDSGKIKSILSIVQDVTQRTQMEIALEKSQKQLSLIYNSAINPMWLISIEDKDRYRFQSINLSFTTVTGWRSDQVVGKIMEEVLPESSHELVRGKYREAIETGKVVDYLEIVVLPAGKKYGEIRIIPIKNEYGEITQLLGIAHDITEREMLYERLEKEREALNQRITNAAIKGQEMERSKVSRELHDHINQVLTTVKLYTELCSAGTVDLNEYLPKCTALLNETITEIRDLSKRLSAPSLGHASFGDTLKDLVESINATGKVQVKLDISKDVCLAMYEELHLTFYRIAQEHLTNILKHAEASEVFIFLNSIEGSMILSIHDNGKGFDPAVKRKGIGITNMASRAKLLNGKLDIVSSPGHGCSLTISIPIVIINKICYPVSEDIMEF
jgi:two-component system, NarL family, sensor kinase